MLNRLLAAIFMFLCFSIAWADEDEFNTERLPIGNPNKKYDFCAVKLNKVFDTNTREQLSFDQLIQRLQNFRIVMLGESHTSEPHHQVQLNIIKGLTESGASVCLALEMFNPSQNQVLEKYGSGELSEDEFLDQSAYFNTWGHNYRYYQPIFDYAREKRIKMFGVNIEADYASKIGRGGIESLSPDQRSQIPEIDTTKVEHRFYFKVAMQGLDAISPAQFPRMYAAQCLWDAAMGEGAIKVAQQNPEAIVLILVGSGHVAYNLGIGKIIEKRSDIPFASVIAVDVPNTVKESVMMKVKKSLKEEKKSDQPEAMKKKTSTMAMMHGGSTDEAPYKIVISSLADFLWGVPKEKQEKYPSLGFSVEEKAGNGFKVKRVIPETVAAKNRIQTGDIILAVDGKEFDNMNQLKRYLSFKNWEDKVQFKILRDGKEQKIRFKIMAGR